MHLRTLALRQRSIPACAGEPRGPVARRRSNGVYPRVCGGTFSVRHQIWKDFGLSPRVRGNRRARTMKTHDDRSIPACAGEPAATRSVAARSGVYPRVCGGTNLVHCSADPFAGLCPRVRGNPDDIRKFRMVSGSIPACAGEPSTGSIIHVTHGVYPRVCGGTPSTKRTSTASIGLSPRVRGNQEFINQGIAFVGSIPACAGEPRRGRLWRRCLPVYPRVCGGTDNSVQVLDHRLGLSPRVRGNPQGLPASCHSVRSIPACAGEP